MAAWWRGALRASRRRSMHRRPSQSQSPISTTICTMLSLKSPRGSDDSFSTATPTSPSSPSSASAVNFSSRRFFALLLLALFFLGAGAGAVAALAVISWE